MELAPRSLVPLNPALTVDPEKRLRERALSRGSFLGALLRLLSGLL